MRFEFTQVIEEPLVNKNIKIPYTEEVSLPHIPDGSKIKVISDIIGFYEVCIKFPPRRELKVIIEFYSIEDYCKCYKQLTSMCLTVREKLLYLFIKLPEDRVKFTYFEDGQNVSDMSFIERMLKNNSPILLNKH